VCTDSCTGVHCIPGQSCVPGDDNQGHCMAAADCTTSACPNPGDQCVNGVCTNPCMACTLSQRCENGACVDRCTGVVCGVDEECRDGVCVSTAPPPTTGGSAGAGGGVVTGGTGGIATTGGTGGIGGASGAAGAGMGGTVAPPEISDEADYVDTGCGCRAAPAHRATPWLLSLAVALLVVLRRRSREHQ